MNKIATKKVAFIAFLIVLASLGVFTLIREMRQMNSLSDTGVFSKDENSNESSSEGIANNGEKTDADGAVESDTEATDGKDADSAVVKGQIFVWGSNALNQLGIKGASTLSAPKTLTFPEKIMSIDAGEAHGLYLSALGNVFAWGNNELHQLGLTPSPTGVVQKIPDLANITKVSTSYRHSLALDTSGKVYSWGSNYTGQIGDGTNNNARTPFAVPGLPKIIDVAAGYKFSIVLAKNGDVYAWGASCAPYDQRLFQNLSNTLQNGSGYYDTVISPRIQASLQEDCKLEDVVGIKSKTPKKLEITDAVQVDSGYGHGLILKKNGTVWSFGCNLYGQLGNRGSSNSPSNAFIQQVPDLENVTKIAAGFRHSLALAKDGTVYTWGGTSANSASDDVRVFANKEIIKVTGLPKIASIFAGKDYSLALSTDGKLYGWGSNTDHVLSDSDTRVYYKPVEIAFSSPLSKIATGANFILSN